MQQQCVGQSAQGFAFKPSILRISMRDVEVKQQRQHRKGGMRKTQNMQHGRQQSSPVSMVLFLPYSIQGQTQPRRHDSHSVKQPRMPVSQSLSG
mmetsp:Transcript_1216/g.4324  ORF Transcript_1216/g.4324 Transcript_1216/m.4324 type:complete len:94 (+) Transcript_1216:488-769(+)